MSKRIFRTVATFIAALSLSSIVMADDNNGKILFNCESKEGGNIVIKHKSYNKKGNYELIFSRDSQGYANALHTLKGKDGVYKLGKDVPVEVSDILNKEHILNTESMQTYYAEFYENNSDKPSLILAVLGEEDLTFENRRFTYVLAGGVFKVVPDSKQKYESVAHCNAERYAEVYFK